MDKFKSISRMILDKILNFIDTPWFAVFLAAIELVSYYLSLDLLIIIVISIFLSILFLFKKKVNSILVLFLFMASMISVNNSPANDAVESNNQFYFQPSVCIICAVFIVIPVIFCIIRAIKNFFSHKIKIDLFFWSLISLSVAFLINGFFANDYNPLNLMFGAFMVFFFCILFFSVLPDVEIDEESVLLISKQVAIYSIVPLVEFFVFYIRFFETGAVFDYRLFVFLGWGNRNTIAMLLNVCFCFVLFLIKFEKKMYLKIVDCVLLFAILLGIIMSFSRQAFIALFAILVIYGLSIILKAKGKKRTILIVTLSSFIFACLTSFLILYFTGILDSFGLSLKSDARVELWESAIKGFASCPIFGRGFFFVGSDPQIQLSNIMPFCCHNSILEMLGACGLIGGLSYILYRIFSFKLFAKNYNEQKLYFGLAVLMILIMSLFDIHLFDLFGTAIYSILLAMAVSNKKPEEIKDFTLNNRGA